MEVLVVEGKLEVLDILEIDGYKFVIVDFIDGKNYDGKDLFGYINSFKIGNKDNV